MGVFSNVFRDLEDISTGAGVVLPDDPTNMARGLRVLEAAGLITLDPLSDRSVATIADIVRNPRDLVFSALPASELVSAMDVNDIAVVTGGFVFAEGLDISAALYNEILGAGYFIVITVRTEDLGRQFVRDILDVIHTDSFKTPITSADSLFNGFQRPLYFIQ
jgi:D-methionine transport system substrate-binding protein